MRDEGSGKKGNPYYRSLARNMVLTVFIVSFTPMILVGGVLLYQFHLSYKQKLLDHLVELVEKHKQNIDGFLHERLHDINYLTKSYTYEELSKEAFLQERLAALQDRNAPAFVDLGVIDESGVQAAYAGPFQLGHAHYFHTDWFKEAIKNPNYVSDVFLGLRGLPHFIITVRDNWNGRPWILRATIDFVAFNNLVQQIRVGQTGFAFILNRQGALQTKPVIETMMREGPYRDFLGIRHDSSEKIHIVEKEDGTGKKYIYVAAFLKNGDWLLVYQQDAEDAFSDLQRAQRSAIVLFFVGGLCIMTMAFLLSRRMVSRIAHADRQKEMMDEQVIESGKLASIGELAAGIAHEINNPVAIMVEEAGWLQDLMEEEEFKEGKNLEEFHRALKQIRTQGYRCKEITHKLLSFARRTDSRVKEIQINDLLLEIVRLSEQRARYSNVNIKVELQDDLPAIQASETEMQQVFLNLVNNALDAMEKRGGTLNLGTREEHAHFDRGIAIDFSDTGTGIPKANLARIFDPFFTTKQVGKGTGLGLSICYGIIRKMGGEITVESTVDVGTTFHLYLPVPGSKGPGTGESRAGGAL